MQSDFKVDAVNTITVNQTATLIQGLYKDNSCFFLFHHPPFKWRLFSSLTNTDAEYFFVSMSAAAAAAATAFLKVLSRRTVCQLRKLER